MTLYVNGERIEPTRIEDEIQRLRPEYETVFKDMEKTARDNQLAEWARENVIESVLLAQQACLQIGAIAAGDSEAEYQKLIQQHGGTEAFEAFIAKHNYSAEVICQDIEKQIQVQRLIEKIESQIPQPSSKQMRRYYEEHIDRFTMPMMVRAAHIVMHPGPDASLEQIQTKMLEVNQKLQAGEDFAKLAGQYSACPERGGDLGYFTRGQMVQNFEDHVFKLKPGQVTGVFETEFGFHIAKMIDIRPACPIPPGDVEELIKKELTQQAKQKAVEAFIDKIKDESVIEEADDK